ncbi:hypothetical protein RD792_011535 [Penstemon davidsonii]|uniref:Uncharacterized protein n=1 Tax=Penstemon davidsonii TaxID=160366 RepID=A0ABR0D0J6_9LAMI|nr:hypothetical protein RD792_011535 [Penstemon davidsonii]
MWMIKNPIFCLHGAEVSWRSSKQYTNANSTIKVEYLAALDVAIESDPSVSPLECIHTSWIVATPQSHRLRTRSWRLSMEEEAELDPALELDPDEREEKEGTAAQDFCG